MAPVFVLARPSPALTTDRRTPTGNWVLHATPSDEKLDLWAYTMSDSSSTRKEYADPAALEAGALELGLPNPLPRYCHEADEPNEPDTIAKKLFIFGFSKSCSRRRRRCLAYHRSLVQCSLYCGSLEASSSASPFEPTPCPTRRQNPHHPHPLPPPTSSSPDRPTLIRFGHPSSSTSTAEQSDTGHGAACGRSAG